MKSAIALAIFGLLMSAPAAEAKGSGNTAKTCSAETDRCIRKDGGGKARGSRHFNDSAAQACRAKQAECMQTGRFLRSDGRNRRVERQ